MEDLPGESFFLFKGKLESGLRAYEEMARPQNVRDDFGDGGSHERDAPRSRLAKAKHQISLVRIDARVLVFRVA
jgi:hypothetical protein